MTQNPNAIVHDDDATTTAAAAIARVLQARIGSLAGRPTLEYLYTLRSEIVTRWLVEIDREIVAAEKRATFAELTVEFTGGHDARVRGLGRILRVTVTTDGRYRVVISGENPISANLGFVVLSDEVMDGAGFEIVKRSLPAGAVVRVGSL